ncbi:MAG: outer membrane lipoprotein LolB [Betaproteobacteria bacterium]|nr:outer membrane lipoprotein LolB [Betaproteobacteria bacterium]
MLRRTALIALPTGLLAACASAPRERPARFWSGRLGLQVQSSPPQDVYAGFELQGGPEHGELTLLSPIGSVLARLSWSPGHALLEQGGQHWTDSSLDALTQRLVNTVIPVQALFDWLEGRASPGGDWQVDLSAWSAGRIQAQRLSPPSARLRIVLER